MRSSFTPFLLSFTLVACVAGKWLDPSPQHSFEEYCNPGGAQVEAPHVCFRTTPDFFAIIDTLHGDGYPAPGLKGSVLIPTAAVPLPRFNTQNHDVEVEFEPETTCAWVKWAPRGAPVGRANRICAPQMMDLPKDI